MDRDKDEGDDFLLQGDQDNGDEESVVEDGKKAPSPVFIPMASIGWHSNEAKKFFVPA